MAKVYTSADQLVGGTPLLELTNLEKELGLKARILAKLEYLNPAGSVKDRVAKRMIVPSSLSRLPEIRASAWQRLQRQKDTESSS